MPHSHSTQLYGLGWQRPSDWARSWLEATRRIPGYHDEPLKGQGQGYRSVRLSQAYRAIYSERDDETVEFAQVETVNKHRY